MINKGTVIRGKRWGPRLQTRLRNPPAGITNWMERHTDVVKDDHSTLAGFLRMSHKQRFLKLYRRRSMLHKLAYLMRIGRPLRTFRVSLALAGVGVPVPEPLCCMLSSEGLLLLTEALLRDSDYNALWQRAPSEEEARLMMRGAGQTLANLHLAGYTHGDCKWSNLLWIDRVCHLVDLDGTRRRLVLGQRARARDIARFTISAEEAGASAQLLEDFLESYLNTTGAAREDLVRRMQPHLEKFRGRHRDRYGIAPQPLL